MVFAIHWHESATGVLVSRIPSHHLTHLPPHPMPQGCPSAPASSALFHALNLDWSSISHVVIYTFQCYSLKSSHPHLLPQSPKVCSLHLCLFYYLTYRVIVTIVLNSIYIGINILYWCFSFWLTTFCIIGSSFICLIQFSHSVMTDSLWPHELQHARPPCPSPTPGVYSNSCPLSWWCHPTISSSVIPFSSRPQSFPASGSFPMSQLFTSGGQSTGVSASTSVLPVNIQDWFPLGWTGWIWTIDNILNHILWGVL